MRKMMAICDNTEHLQPSTAQHRIENFRKFINAGKYLSTQYYVNIWCTKKVIGFYLTVDHIPLRLMFWILVTFFLVVPYLMLMKNICDMEHKTCLLFVQTYNFLLELLLYFICTSISRLDSENAKNW